MDLAERGLTLRFHRPALLGYGVAASAEAMLGIPRALVFDSPLDLIHLSSVAVLELFSKAEEVFLRPPLYWQFYADKGLVLASLVVCWAGLRIAVQRWKGRVPDFLLRFKGISTEQRAAQGDLDYWIRTVLGTVLIAASPVLIGLTMWMLTTMLLLVAVVPSVGETVGEAYINQWVISPKRCLPTPTLAQRRASLQKHGAKAEGAREPVANCVMVRKEGAVLGEGRLVFSVSKAVILVGDDGVARRIPSADAVVEPVPELSKTVGNTSLTTTGKPSTP